MTILAAGYAYRFGDIERFSFGFPSPNLAGLALAMALPLFWGLLAFAAGRWQRGWHLLVATGEYSVFFMLCLTLSRGALVAVVGGMMHHLAVRLFVARPNWGQEKWTWCVRPVAYAFLAAGRGLAARMAQGIAGDDPSALNRLDYWSAGLATLQNMPWTGVSIDRYGTFFMNWFGDLDSFQHVTGFINTYLDWGVAWGLLALGGLVLPLIWSACFPFFLKRQATERQRLAGCVISNVAVVFGTAIFFSPLLGSMTINAAITVLVAASFWMWFRGCDRRGWFTMGMIGVSAVVVLGPLYVPVPTRQEFTVNIDGTGAVTLRRVGRDDTGAGKGIVLACDWEIMGTVYGREARQLMGNWPQCRRMIALAPDDEMERHIPDGDVLVFGRRWKSLLPISAKGAMVTLVHPLGLPDDSLGTANLRAIVLPAIDEEGSLNEWLAFSRKHGIRVLRTTGGQELLENWTETIISLL